MSATRWLPFGLGMLLGLAGGLYYAWLVNPVEYVETAPDSLRQDFRMDYLALIGAAYAGTGDLSRARARLALFPELDPQEDLSAIAQQRFAAGLGDARGLAQLAADLQAAPTATATPTATSSGPRPTTPSSPRPTVTSSPRPTVTSSPRPTATPRPTVTPDAPFALAEREQVCDPVLAEPLIQVEVFDASGEPVPGVEVLVVWDTGQDHFFTGLKPELGLGYGDFTMTPEVDYTLRLADSGPPLTDLATHLCETDDDDEFLGSWYLQFEQSP